MGEIKKPAQEKLVMGLIYRDPLVLEKARKILEKKYGSIDYESPELDFNFTEYYGAEMGRGLKRRFMSFKKTVDPSLLPGIKIFTNSLEQKSLYPGTNNRMINIDPGLLSMAKFVLATTKDFSHRIYIGEGIYAEVTLQYKAGAYAAWEWTYPDYRTQEYRDILNRIREIYRGQVQSKK
jgi:hypothetical protein